MSLICRILLFVITIPFQAAIFITEYQLNQARRDLNICSIMHYGEPLSTYKGDLPYSNLFKLLKN